MLTLEQREVASSIIDCVVGNVDQLMFLQGSAGTGKTFTVQVIVGELRRRGMRCLISATMGIAAAQYEGGSTVHSLFCLDIDEASGGEFRCNI
jgi:RecG-like helicase